MGWTTYPSITRRELIADILRGLNHENENSKLAVIAHCMVGNNMWGVCERTMKTGERAGEAYRFIVLYLIRRYGPDEWGYKDMDEDCGPNEVSCPLSYLDLAPATTHLGEYSKAWRERVRQHWEKQRTGRALARTLKEGDKFQWGQRIITFCYRSGRNFVVGDSERGRFRYRITTIEPVGTPAESVVEPVVFKKEVVLA